jgi:hypothetical protein
MKAELWNIYQPAEYIFKYCRYPRERNVGTPRIGGWVDPRGVLDAVVKRKIPSPGRESNPKTPIVQPVAQNYTDWAITALSSTLDVRNIRHINLEDNKLARLSSISPFQWWAI